MRTSWRKLVRPGRPVLLPISHSVVRRGGEGGEGYLFLEIPFVFTMKATLTRRRHTREFDGNIGGTETTIPFFHFFFLFLFLFLFPFLFFSAQERSTNYYYLFFWPPMISNTLSLFKSFK